METYKNEYFSMIEEVGKQVADFINGDLKRSAIIIATETNDDGTESIMSITGTPGELAKGISNFAKNDKMRSIFIKGLELAQTEIMAQVLIEIEKIN